MNHFNYQAYRILLRDQAAAWKEAHKGYTLQRIAELAKIQAPYLTNALKERAHLNQDQIFALGQIFEWETELHRYCTLLMEWERSGNPARKKLLKEEIDRIRKEKLSSQAHLKKQVMETPESELNQFFLNPFYSLIHAFMGVERFSREPMAVARKLGIEGRQFRRWLGELVEMKFLDREGDAYRKLKKNFHLPKDSPLCAPHLQLFGLATAQHLLRIPEEEKYNFSVTFSADAAARENIQREYLLFLKKVEAIVKEAPSEEIFGLRFDLFRWS
jgi:uncharacterized protein (TIGR02147 family)